MSGAARSNRGGRRRWLALAALTTVLAGALGWYLWSGRQPQPPTVNLDGADPAVVRAVTESRRAVQTSPRSANAWGELGKLLLCYQFEPEARTCFVQAARLDPREPRWPYLQALTLVQDDPETAVALLRRAADLCGDHPDAPRLRLAELLLQLGRLDESAEQFEGVLRHEPANARAHLGLARIALERNDPNASRSHLERAAANRLTRKAARTLLAEVEQRLREVKAAAEERDRAALLPDDPPWPDPYREEVSDLQAGKQATLNRIQKLRAAGHTAEAQALADEVEQQYPDVWWLVEGRVLLQKGDLDGAERALRKSVELAPQAVEGRLSLATLLQRRHDSTAAAACFQQVLVLEPDYGPAYQGLASCCREQGDRAGAIRWLREAVPRMPNNAEAQRELGELLLEEGQHAEAVVHLRHATELDPADERARHLLNRAEEH